MISWITDNIGYEPSAVNIGVIETKSELHVVDTGLDNSAINRVIKQSNKPIRGAFITHHHADHMGGCRKLQIGFNAKIFSPKFEREFFTAPYLEPFSIFGGAVPPKFLRSKHLQAKAIQKVENAQENTLVTVVETPGHSPDHYAYLFEDIIFAGDSVFTEQTIEKYKLLFAVNPEQAVNSLMKLREVNFDVMILGHGELQESKSEALSSIDRTKESYLASKETILETVGESMKFSNYTEACLKTLGIDLIVAERGVIQFYLYRVSLLGYLSNFIDAKILELNTVPDGLMIQAI